jgi:hypothetical protein
LDGVLAIKSIIPAAFSFNSLLRTRVIFTPIFYLNYSSTMRFTTTILSLLSATALAAPAAEPNIAARQDLNTQCSNLGESWCVGGQTWTCRQITFDRGLVTNTYKDCGAKIKRQDLNTQCSNLGE